jgi:hypothetical protein
MIRDDATLQAALVGYQAQLDALTAKMVDLRKLLRASGRTFALHGGGGDIPTPFAKPRKKRRMSAAGRKRIAAAQRKRWAAYKKAKE